MSSGSLQAGALVLINFDPAIGHEQSGRRPAVVVSETEYNDSSNCCVVCPITSNTAPWPFKVALAADCAISGSVLVDQIKSVDRRRVLRSVGVVAPELLAEIRGRLAALVGLAIEPSGRAS